MVSSSNAVRVRRAKRQTTTPARTNNEIRSLLLRYFYDRNDNATSTKGKKGSGVKISDVKRQQEIQRNLTYLISQGWVQEDEVSKSVPLPSGTLIPQVTPYYRITAAGIDKIEGPGEFTMEKFHGIKIEATGRNIITVGDGNKIDATFGDLGNALADLRNGISKSDIAESEKLSFVADIDTIQSQLAKPQPNRNIVAAAWQAVKAVATINGLAGFVERAGVLIAPLMT
jgi:hypothetical protein